MSKQTETPKYFVFFSKFFWIAILFVLITIILQEKLDNKGEYYFILNTLAILLSTIGLTVIVASIFTYALGTKEFIDYIEQKLENIIVERNFLKNMDTGKKINALHAILKPNILQERIYTNLEEFYEYYIKDIMNVSKKNVRSDYNVNVVMKYDKKLKKIYAKGSVVYRLYPSEDGFEPITLGLSNDEISKCERLEIFESHGKKHQIDLDTLDYQKNSENMNIAAIEIGEYDTSNNEHLIIEIDFIEYGFDHWMAFKFLIFQATDGINFDLQCYDGITIKEKTTFDTSTKYHESVNSDIRYKTSSHQWVQEGSGLMVIVSKPEKCHKCKTKSK